MGNTDGALLYPDGSNHRCVFKCFLLFLQIFGMGVAYGDGSIAILLLHHQLSHWLAYDVVSSNGIIYLPEDS